MVLAAAAAGRYRYGLGRWYGIAFLDTNSPDLQAGSDPGISSVDNITNQRNLTFVYSDVSVGATVELLRDDVSVTSTTAGSTSVTLSDLNVPTNTNLHYVARQDIAEQRCSGQCTDCRDDRHTGAGGHDKSDVGSARSTSVQPLTFACIQR
jgi:hypothetical protein